MPIALPPLLEARELRKRFPNGVAAVDGVSFRIPHGRCFGLLGPNGAGKTTTVEMLEGIVTPSGGTVLYQGEPLGPRFREEAGIMFQSTALQDFMTAREALEMFGSFYPRRLPVAELATRCALGEFLDREARRLSGGQRQRLLLAIALVNDPAVLFLDEPTTGLDPQARHNFWHLVRDIKAAGRTIILTTHYMDEAYQLCDEVAIMDHGRIIAQDTPQALLAAHFDEVILQLPRADLPDEIELPWPRLRHDGIVEILTRDLDGCLQTLLHQGVKLARLRIRERTLEDLFLQLTGKELRQ
ncbi:MAG TPA: ABC transporter ATP-binding protein [Candidatus Competibacteraceae bacterium]|nr:ABC transporter ATP-binding protein [Candidatus Competibacteraceae bacterium]